MTADLIEQVRKAHDEAMRAVCYDDEKMAVKHEANFIVALGRLQARMRELEAGAALAAQPKGADDAAG